METKKTDRIFYIYKMTDPRNGIVMYVGKTSHPKRRECCHCTKASKGSTREWVDELRKEGLRPIFEIIAETTFKNASKLEKYYICLHHNDHMLNKQIERQTSLGHNYFNLTEGAHRFYVLIGRSFDAGDLDKMRFYMSRLEQWSRKYKGKDRPATRRESFSSYLQTSR